MLTCENDDTINNNTFLTSIWKTKLEKVVKQTTRWLVSWVGIWEVIDGFSGKHSLICLKECLSFLSSGRWFSRVCPAQLPVLELLWYGHSWQLLPTPSAVTEPHNTGSYPLRMCESVPAFKTWIRSEQLCILLALERHTWGCLVLACLTSRTLNSLGPLAISICSFLQEKSYKCFLCRASGDMTPSYLCAKAHAPGEDPVINLRKAFCSNC